MYVCMYVCVCVCVCMCVCVCVCVCKHSLLLWLITTDITSAMNYTISVLVQTTYLVSIVLQTDRHQPFFKYVSSMKWLL